MRQPPEHNKRDWSYANTGVLIINVAAMRREHAPLIEYASTRLNAFGPLGKGTYDQGILNAYFRGRWSRMPLEMNWKPYWGWNLDASIVHFHGPKPVFAEAILAGKGNHLPPVYQSLVGRDRRAYKRYVEISREFEEKLILEAAT